MQNIATECDLKHYDMFLHNELLFFVNGREENLSLFATRLQSEIPLSLYFIFKNVEVAKNMTKEYSTNITKNTCSFDFSLGEINAIKDINNINFCNIFDFPHSKIDFEIYYKNNVLDSKDSLKSALLEIVSILENNKSVILQTTKGKIEISLDTKDFDFIIANDIANISVYTRASKDEIEALATFEKPSITLRIKELFIDELGFSKALFILPYDVILYIISSLLLDKEIAFLYAKKVESSNKFSDIESKINTESTLESSIKTNKKLAQTQKQDKDIKLSQNSIVILDYQSDFKDEFFEIVVGQRGYFIQKKFLQNDSKNGNLNKIDSNFLDFTFNNRYDKLFISYISTLNETIFGILDNKNLTKTINIHFDMNPKNILDSIAKRPNGTKLLQNYKQNFKDSLERIKALDSTPKYTNNILDIFAVVSFILGFELKKEQVLIFAESYLRDIGPKIDFKNINVNGELYYDNISTIHSIMSFTLAGIDNETLCFGMVESLIDYLILLMRDISVNYGVENMGIAGDIFANTTFFDRLSKKFPLDLNLIFPNYLDLTFFDIM